MWPCRCGRGPFSCGCRDELSSRLPDGIRTYPTEKQEMWAGEKNTYRPADSQRQRTSHEITRKAMPAQQLTADRNEVGHQQPQWQQYCEGSWCPPYKPAGE